MTSEARDTNADALESEALEDLLDATQMRLARIEQANDEAIPGAMVRRLAEGAVPLTVWREFRGLSVEALVNASGVAASVVLTIEDGKDDVSLRVFSILAQALRVDVDDLVPWTNAVEIGP